MKLKETIVYPICDSPCVIINIVLKKHINMIIHNGYSAAHPVWGEFIKVKCDFSPFFDSCLSGLCLESDSKEFEVSYLQDGIVKTFKPKQSNE